MGVKVYYSEISGQKEVKKRQQRVMMILESKQIPYEAIDITDPSKETDKEFMKTNAKTRGDAKYVVAPQIFNEEEYCGDFEDFELANENDELESFLKCPKAENNNVNKVTNGTSRGSSAEAEAKPAAEAPVQNDTPVEEPAPSEEVSTTVAEESAPPAEEAAATEEAEPSANAGEDEEEEEADE